MNKGNCDLFYDELGFVEIKFFKVVKNWRMGNIEFIVQVYMVKKEFIVGLLNIFVEILGGDILFDVIKLLSIQIKF